MSLYNGIKSWVKRIVEIFMRWGPNDFSYTAKQITTPRGWLKLLDGIGGYVLAFAYFSHVARSQWQRISCPGNAPLRDKVGCFSRQGLPCAMVVILGLVFVLSRRSAKRELGMSEKLFPQGRMPEHWIFPTDPMKILISVAGFFLAYMAAAWNSGRIVIVSALMLGIACIDWNTLRWIKGRTDKYLRDPEFAPTPKDPDYDLINQRRDIIREYFYEKPQQWKETGRVAGCATALFVAVIGAQSAAYLVLMGTLIANEIITAKWRAQRDRPWLSLEDTSRNSIGKESKL